MREAPTHVSDDEVLATVRAQWDPSLVSVTHLAVGFGAHHWRADGGSGPRLFVTFDGPDPRRTPAELEATYAAAGALGLPFVVPSLRSGAGSRTVPLADGHLSVTPWLHGSSGNGGLHDRDEAEATAAMVHALHQVPVPAGTVDWRPVVSRVFPAELALSLGGPWETGPYGERARASLAGRIDDIGRWTGRYVTLVASAAARPWVPTHGEPHTANQLVTGSGRFLVDWETLRRSPAERDLRVLVEHGFADLAGPDLDRDMVEMFDLEWRLDEIASYARWFMAPHEGTRSDEVAYGGLLGELERADFTRG